MSAKDDYPPKDLLSGSASLYEALWAELDELRSRELTGMAKLGGRMHIAGSSSNSLGDPPRSMCGQPIPVLLHVRPRSHVSCGACLRIAA